MKVAFGGSTGPNSAANGTGASGDGEVFDTTANCALTAVSTSFGPTASAGAGGSSAVRPIPSKLSVTVGAVAAGVPASATAGDSAPGGATSGWRAASTSWSYSARLTGQRVTCQLGRPGTTGCGAS